MDTCQSEKVADDTRIPNPCLSKGLGRIGKGAKSFIMLSAWTSFGCKYIVVSTRGMLEMDIYKHSSSSLHMTEGTWEFLTNLEPLKQLMQTTEICDM